MLFLLTMSAYFNQVTIRDIHYVIFQYSSVLCILTVEIEADLLTNKPFVKQDL